ncbi:MAG: TonB-dependent receptor [Balneolaceae bacterium]
MKLVESFCNYNWRRKFTATIFLLTLCTFTLAAQDEAPKKNKIILLSAQNNNYGQVIQQDKDVQFSRIVLEKIVSIKAENEPLLKILESVAKQAGLKLSYERQNIPSKLRKSVSIEKLKLKDALWEILEGTDLRFGISPSKHLVIFKAEKPNQPISQREQEEITGKVTDAATGEEMPGVNIILKGTTTGTSTNNEGQYQLEVPSLQDTLIFSFIGYQRREVPINGQTVIDIQLTSEAISGDELVVVGFGRQSRANITSSINSITSENISKVPTATIGNALTGQTRGLQVIQSSGEPGRDDPQIYLRGVSSLSAGRSQPLYVLDGVVVRDARSVTRLDPDNIQNISILKDASATAVYGVEGANGVIVVETKQGRSGSLNISVNTSTGLQAPTLNQEFADSYTYALAFNEAQINDGIAPDRVRFSDTAIEAFRTGSDPLIYPSVDWVDYFMKDNILQHRTNISLSGGSDDVRFFVAGGYQNQEGLFKTFESDYNYNPSYFRYNIRSNLDIDVTPTTQISLKSNSRIENWVHANRFQWVNQYLTPPFAGAGIIDGKVVASSDRYISGPKRYNPDFYGSGYTETNRSDLNLNLSLRQELNAITEGLALQLRGAYNATFNQSKSRTASQPNYEPYYRTDVDPSAPGDSTVVFRRVGEERLLDYSESIGKDRDWYAEARLEYEQDFGEHELEGLLLYGQRKRYYPNQFRGIPRGLISTVGRVNYNYDRRYLLELSMGYNGSENFAEEYRFGFFPAISGGWIITNEAFMPDMPFLNFMKVRASYGLVGNDTGVGRFLYLPTEYNVTAAGYNFGYDVPQNQQGASEGQIGNPQITWERAYKQNYGLDLRFFRDRLDVTFDYFHEFRDGILTARNTIPSYVAASLPPGNIGQVKNRGYELEVEWRNQHGDFFYSIGGYVTHSKNEIVHIDEPIPNEPYQSRIGHPVGQEFGWVFDGFYTEEDMDRLGDDLAVPSWDVKPGYLKYKDLNGDGIIDEDDVTAIGHPQDIPEYSFGSTINLNFKGIDLSMVWAAATNVSEVLTQAPNRVPFGHDGARSMRQWQWEGRWTPDRDPDEVIFPLLSISEAQNRVDRDSDFWQMDASYIRLKSLELGYTFNRGFVQSMGMRNLRIYMNAYNPLTFSHMMDTYSIDPEQGGHRTEADYPVMKVYNFGIKVDF